MKTELIERINKLFKQVSIIQSTTGNDKDIKTSRGNVKCSLDSDYKQFIKTFGGCLLLGWIFMESEVQMT